MPDSPILRAAEREIEAIRRKAAAAEHEAELARMGILREVVTHENGKTFTRFIGCHRAAWTPFMPPVRNFITGFNNRPNRGGGR